MDLPAFFFLMVSLGKEGQMEISRPMVPPPVDPSSIGSDHPLRQAAEGMEANFFKEMLRNMRKTVKESPEMENSRGYQIFRGMLDDQYAEMAAKTQGIGLAELIIKQVLEMQQQQVPLSKAPAPAAGNPAPELNKSDAIGKEKS